MSNVTKYDLSARIFYIWYCCFCRLLGEEQNYSNDEISPYHHSFLAVHHGTVV